MARRHPSGMTLLEILITLTIVTILVAIAVPQVSNLSSVYQLRGAAQEVAADLQFARLLAIKEDLSMNVTFTSNSYQVSRVSNGSVVKSRNMSSDYPGAALSVVALTFYSRGTSTGGTVTVSNAAGTRSVLVNTAGLVRIQ